MSSFFNNIKALNLIPAESWNGEGNKDTATGVDLQGAESVAVVINTGTVEAGADHIIKFYEGDVNTLTIGSSTEIPSARVLVSPTIDDTDNTTYVYNIKPNKRYLKVRVTSSGDIDIDFSVTAILGHLAEKP